MSEKESVMAEVQCGKFKPIERNPQTSMVTWSAPITPTPTPVWQRAFAEELTAEHAIGPVFSTRPVVKGLAITFGSPETAAEAAASVIHRVVEKANRAAGRHEAQEREQQQADAKKLQDSAEELARLKEKYRDGI
jgi:hypothetical protein